MLIFLLYIMNKTWENHVTFFFFVETKHKIIETFIILPSNLFLKNKTKKLVPIYLNFNRYLIKFNTYYLTNNDFKLNYI